MCIIFRGNHSLKAAENRRRWVENITKTPLSNLQLFHNKHPVASVENAIGVVSVPVGVVGPVEIHGKYANDTFFVPASTLQSSLVASACRGATALRKAGGVKASAYRQRVASVSTFFCDSPKGAEELGAWIGSSLADLTRVVTSVCKKAQLKSLDFFVDEKVKYHRIFNFM